jgi:hypothetical protein
MARAMQLSRTRTRPVRSTLRRIVCVAAAVSFAALVAAGCGGDGAGSDPGESGIVGSEGPLSWLPGDTWLVASARLDPTQLDTAIKTLDRLPAWSLVESFLPADDGAGLRREALKALAKSGNSAAGGSGPKLSAKQLEDAFGERVGMALTDTDFESFESAHPPLAVWVEVDDEDLATNILEAASQGKDKVVEHEGVEYRHSKGKSGDTFAFLVRDGLAVIAPTKAQIERLIDAHEGDHSLAHDETGRAVIEGGIGEAIAGVAVQTDPLLEATPKLVRTLAKDADDPEDAAKAREIARKLGPVLTSAAVDGLVADWTSASITIDATGLRVRGAWSNPHQLADPDIGSRELVERMPADAPMASASASDGTMLGRAQDAWAEVQDAYDIDLRDLAKDCGEPADQWACDLAAEAATAVLEDEDLAEAMEDRGDRSSAYIQDLGTALQSVIREAQGGAPKAPSTRVIEIASSGDPIPDWTPPASLVDAARKAGIVVTTTDDHSKLTVRVLPGSPLATSMQALHAEDVNVVAQMYGIEPEQLLTPKGVSFDITDVDGIKVAGLPNDATSTIVPALEGDADTLGDDEDYARVVDAAKVPKDVGIYGYIDLRGYIESMFGSLAADDKNLARVLPTIRNNLADAPGLVIWSGRDKVDDEEIGTWQYVLPILE